jgi:poly-gamma-glutamate capsule biosynthesis protein CapA/YwtB (metallophosphatase superfamily)
VRTTVTLPATAMLLAMGACSGGGGDVTGGPTGPGPSRSGDRSATGPPSPGTASPTPSGAASGAATDTRTPLAIAVHPSRGRVRLTGTQADDLREGLLDDWADLGSAPGPLRVGALSEVRADRDVVALVPAATVGPRVSVATVDGVDPLRDPATYAMTVPGPAAPEVTTVTVTGDVMLGRRVGDRLAALGDPAAALRPMARRLASADLTVGNLESTLSKAGAPRQGGDSFGSAPSVRQGLRLAGYDVLSLANNHTGDYGRRALLDTVERVRAGGFAAVGAGPDLASAMEPVVVERNGVRFGIVAFDAIGETPAAGPSRPGALRLRMQPRTGTLVPADLDRVTGIVRGLRTMADPVDVVLVLPHWGTQYSHRTVRDQRVVARALVDAGADLVVGGHPHWVQGMEAVGSGLIAYSLGNFVFDMDFSRKTQEGTVLELTFWGTELKGARQVPVVIGPDFAPRVASGPRGDAILRDVWAASRSPLGGTHAP